MKFSKTPDRLHNQNNMSLSGKLIGIFKEPNAALSSLQSIVRQDAGVYDIVPIEADCHHWILCKNDTISLRSEHAK